MREKPTPVESPLIDICNDTDQMGVGCLHLETRNEKRAKSFPGFVNESAPKRLYV